MNITVICPGKLKERYLSDAVKEYEKRLGAYGKIQIIELTPVRLSENPSENEILAALEREAQTIRSKIPNSSYTYALCIEGKERSSEALAAEIEALSVNGTGSICFIIGSSYGLSQSLKNECDNRLSFSPMTFPHQLMRVLLLEQLYRVFQINNNGKYHK